MPLDEVIAKLAAEKVVIEVGPAKRTGARWPIRSVYVRDPDNNLIEISEQWQDAPASTTAASANATAATAATAERK